MYSTLDVNLWYQKMTLIELLIRKALKQPIFVDYAPDPTAGSDPTSWTLSCLEWMHYLQSNLQTVVKNNLDQIIRQSSRVAAVGANPVYIEQKAIR